MGERKANQIGFKKPVVHGATDPPRRDYGGSLSALENLSLLSM